ncbi:MAG: glycine cleavage system aminomethyltransferase GcvT, partial [Candidatus Methanomethylophilaceae archaeon]
MDLKRTPLHGCHLELSAKMVDFAGWEMPIQFAGIIEEHMKVRNACGVFDVSHMGDLLIRGPQARELLSRLLSNNIELATPGKGIYSHILRPDGTILDDTIVYRLDEEDYLMVPNASTKDSVLSWVEQNNPGAEVIDLSDALASIAVQGPLAEEILQRLTDTDLSEIKRFR